MGQGIRADSAFCFSFLLVNSGFFGWVGANLRIKVGLGAGDCGCCSPRWATCRGASVWWRGQPGRGPPLEGVNLHSRACRYSQVLYVATSSSPCFCLNASPQGSYVSFSWDGTENGLKAFMTELSTPKKLFFFCLFGLSASRYNRGGGDWLPKKMVWKKLAE